MEEQNLYDSFNFALPSRDPANAKAIQTVVTTYVCPSDPAADNPIIDHRCQVAVGNPVKCLGLWYPASMGPTEPNPGLCVFCPNTTPSSANFCCQGTDYGQNGSFVGLFGRSVKAVRFREVTDGLSTTIMNGESLPSNCIHNLAYGDNFPMCATNIPLNTMTGDGVVITTDDNANHGLQPAERTCGFKSRHVGGANFLMADGSVHFFAETIDFMLFNNLGTRAGNETVSVP